MAASTYVFYDGSIAGQQRTTFFTPNEDSPFALRNIIDCSKQTLDAGEGDIAQVLLVPAGTTVIDAWLRIITAETANGTVDLGYGGAVNHWGNALAVDGTAGTIAATALRSVPVHFGSADTIDLVATTDTADVDIDGFKGEVVAICIKALDAY